MVWPLLLLLLLEGFAFRPVGFLGGWSVIHPCVWGKPSKSSITSDDVLELWADHGAHVICLLCWARALVQQGRVHSRQVHLGAVASRTGGLIRHGGTQSDGQLP